MSRQDRLSQYLEARLPIASRPRDEGDLYVPLATASTRHTPQTYKLDPTPRTAAQSSEARRPTASRPGNEGDLYVPLSTASTRHTPQTYKLDPTPRTAAQSSEARRPTASRPGNEGDLYVPLSTASTRHTPQTYKLDPTPRTAAQSSEARRPTASRPGNEGDLYVPLSTASTRHTPQIYKLGPSPRTATQSSEARRPKTSRHREEDDIFVPVATASTRDDGDDGDDDDDDDDDDDGDYYESPPLSPKPFSKTARTLSRADALLEVQQDFKIYSGPRNLYVPAKAMFNGCAFLAERADGCIGLDFLLEDLEYSDCREGQIVKLKCTTTDGKIFHKNFPFYVHFQVIDREHLEILLGREFIQSNREGFVNQTIGSKKKKGEELTAAEIADLLQRQKMRDELTPKAPTSQGSISGGKISGQGWGSAR